MNSVNPKLLIFCAVIALIVNTCKEHGTDPIESFKSPSEMNWVADTLRMPDNALQFIPEDMLVLSPQNIWLAVWISHGQVFHYDGNNMELSDDIGGGIDCLVGANMNNLWAGGYIGRDENGKFIRHAFIGHYNGSTWDNKEFDIKTELLDMCNDGKGNLWACGRNGLVFKYTDNVWSADTVKIQIPKNSEYILKSIEYFNGKINIVGYAIDNETPKNVFYYINGYFKNWTVVDSFTISKNESTLKWGTWGLCKVGEKDLYTFGPGGVWRNYNGMWKNDLEFNGEMYNMYGARSDYIFAVSAFKKIYFYDGSSWQLISELFDVADPYFVFNNVWTNGHETFVLGYGIFNGTQNIIVWHGK